MRATIDKSGRVVIPVALRRQIGLRHGEVEITLDGSALRIEPIRRGRLIKDNGLFVVADDGPALTPDEIRELRLTDQR
ncbi:AbrB/MazE/SpoVT family DNA-binding domain-containing protein [Propionimicrobium sp. PCR01-08-3]|uniref:AbrB/MazE/SpoVT family DNA-binding domain-containing protein n=1 Tax=Propionimicrobium sp. PCR01-08-3 TaxID=3052086 RepID=UPI00255CB9A3|nr:AbrB/MazE/SpoVT family DNA-binding domain-containing protein [Propionimicrobium sp. PCR01-08-3]WIY81671.1 AbrB/MazE/SpoVT family DNA-binding domain-containing protein [Propionimicrobium sp. PCR01-08-3]